MEKGKKIQIALWFLMCFAFLSHPRALPHSSKTNSVNVTKDISVGLILDMSSWLGMTVHSCVTMAISDFYALNSHYKTRILLHARDSRGEPLRALSAAFDLLENKRVQAIIGPETYIEAKFLAVLGDKTKVPIFSFVSSTFSSGYPYFLQITQDETTQFEGIASVIEVFEWSDVIVIYEDTERGRENLPYLVESLREKNVHVSYRSAISPLAVDDQILEELHKIRTLQTTICIVHMSPSLASRLFMNAKFLGLMSEGHAWIITDRTMNFIHSIDPEAIESIEGALGFKPYVPASSKLGDLTLRWRQEYYAKDPNMNLTELNVFGIWAYDAVWALAEATEKIRAKITNDREHDLGWSSVDRADIGMSQIGTTLLDELSQIRFNGLSGEFQLMNGKLNSKAFVIQNVLTGNAERRVGFWEPQLGITKEMYPSFSRMYPSSFNSGLEAILWPGGTRATPKGRLMQKSGTKLKIGVPINHGFNELVTVQRHPETNATTVTGFCIDVFNAAMEALQYQVSYEFAPFMDDNEQSLGSFNDLIDQVYLKNYDAVVGDVTITANRSLYVDFTLPYTDLGVGTIAKQQVDHKDMWIFLKPLHRDLWLTSAAFLVLTGFIVWLIEHPINEEFQGSPARQIRAVLLFSFSTLVPADRDKLKSTISKFIVTTWLLIVLILSSTYTATLASLLTVRQIELASPGDYIGYHNGASLQGARASNLNFEDDRLRPYSSPEEYADALSRGSKNGGVAAIVDEIPYIKIFLAKYSADYAMISSESTTNGFGFVFQKGSPLVPNVSRAIAKLREEGMLLMMEKKWFKSGSSFMPDDSATKPSILTVASFRGLFLLSGISLSLGLLTLLIYRLKQRFCVDNYMCQILAGGKLVFLFRYLFTRGPISEEK